MNKTLEQLRFGIAMKLPKKWFLFLVEPFFEHRQNSIFDLSVSDWCFTKHIKSNSIYLSSQGFVDQITCASNDQRFQVQVQVLRPKNLIVIVLFQDVFASLIPIRNRHVKVQHNQVKEALIALTTFLLDAVFK